MGRDSTQTLLARHTPRLRYDSAERAVAIAVTDWLAAPGCRLERADGTVLSAGAALPAALTLPARADDRLISGPSLATPAALAPAARASSYRVYGRAAAGSDDRLWLTYWFFYAYNDYTLLGPFLGAGRHEGDWEMIQLRLDPAGERPDLALATQHAHVAARAWDDVERIGDQPVIYVARGDHASYFSPGLKWTGHWVDHVDGRGPSAPSQLEILDASSTHAWVHWPGRWGGTLPGHGIGRRIGFDASSPHGPGHQRQWRDPARLLADIRPGDLSPQCP